MCNSLNKKLIYVINKVSYFILRDPNDVPVIKAKKAILTKKFR
jgi:hypothetical protein